MILFLASPPRFFCDRLDCIVAALDASEPHTPITRATRVPLTERCAHCRADLFDRVDRTAESVDTGQETT